MATPGGTASQPASNIPAIKKHVSTTSGLEIKKVVPPKKDALQIV
jgi:hypothetical protein